MGNEECPVHLDLLWQTEVSSSIYSTPLVSDINRWGTHPNPCPLFPPSLLNCTPLVSNINSWPLVPISLLPP